MIYGLEVAVRGIFKQLKGSLSGAALPNSVCERKLLEVLDIEAVDLLVAALGDASSVVLRKFISLRLRYALGLCPEGLRLEVSDWPLRIPIVGMQDAR
jgi:hypothetical protein